MTFERRTVTKTTDTSAHVDAPAIDPPVVAAPVAAPVVAPVVAPVAAPAVVDHAVRTRSTIETTDVQPSGGEQIRRVVVLIFGIVQIFIGLRIALLLLNAREGNDLVAFILNISQLFVAPFIGIFNTDALRSSGSILDIAAIAALVGWTVLELIIFWVLNLFRREPV